MAAPELQPSQSPPKSVPGELSAKGFLRDYPLLRVIRFSSRRGLRRSISIHFSERERRSVPIISASNRPRKRVARLRAGHILQCSLLANFFCDHCYFLSNNFQYMPELRAFECLILRPFSQTLVITKRFITRYKYYGQAPQRFSVTHRKSYCATTTNKSQNNFSTKRLYSNSIGYGQLDQIYFHYNLGGRVSVLCVSRAAS